MQAFWLKTKMGDDRENSKDVAYLRFSGSVSTHTFPTE